MKVSELSWEWTRLTLGTWEEQKAETEGDEKNMGDPSSDFVQLS